MLPVRACGPISDSSPKQDPMASAEPHSLPSPSDPSVAWCGPFVQQKQQGLVSVLV